MAERQPLYLVLASGTGRYMALSMQGSNDHFPEAFEFLATVGLAVNDSTHISILCLSVV